MNICSLDYSLNTQSLDIYVSGCDAHPKCDGCHNTEAWDFTIGKLYDKSMRDKIDVYLNEDVIKNVMIFGGEPLDQNTEKLEGLLIQVYKSGLPIWLFTRYDLSDVPDFVKKYCSYIKCGKYIKCLATKDNNMYGISLASSNQVLYKKGVDY